MEKKLVVLGSCVTRDPLEFDGLRDALLYYHCRSNIASLANRVRYDREIRIDGLPPSQHRCVVHDLQKTFRTDFENCVIVFDFIDDRFPMAIKGDAVFTHNPLAANANPKLYEGMNVVRHFDPDNWPIAEHMLKLFALQFSQLFAQNVTVLHMANFSPFYDGIRPGSAYCKTMREYYERIFKKLLEILPFDHVINCMDTITDANSTPRDHRWGHAPFHYHDAYNKAFSQKIRYILS